MRNRASTANLVLSLASYAIFMVIVLVALGFGVGLLELVIWDVLLVVGALLIVRRYRRARVNTSATNPS